MKMKTTTIRVKRREGNIFHCITRGGNEIAFETGGETDPRFHIMGMYYTKGKELPFDFPEEWGIL